MRSLTLAVTAVLAAALGSACAKKQSAEVKDSETPSPPVAGRAAPAPSPTSPHANQVPETPPRGPEHAVYSLWDNRLAAHLQRGGGLFIPAGSAGFVKYLRFGKGKLPWKIRQKQDGARVAVMGGKTSGIYVPLTAEQAAGTPHIRVRAHTAAPQRLGLRLNGHTDKEVTTQLDKAGWQVADIEVPEGALRAGENEILLFAGAAPLAVEWLQIGGDAAPGEDAAAWLARGKSGWKLPDGGGTAHYIAVPRGGRLTADIDSATCTARVTATPHGGEPVSGVLAGKGSAVDLGGLAGRAVRLEILGQGCKKEAVLEKPRIVVGGRPPQVRRGAAPKHVILWIMDSLRADRIAAFVPGARPETPVFSKLAESSAVFIQAYMQGNESKASHASIWSSQYPVRHRMIPPNSHLDTKWTTVDEVAHAAGLYTAGESGNGYITPRRGFGTAWDHFSNHIHEGGGLSAEAIVTKGLAAVEKIDKPWFLYLGTIDTHVSWRAHQPWLDRYDPKPYSGRFKTQASGKDMGLVAAHKLKVSDRDITRIRALYDSNVSYQDQELGQLLAWLDEKGVADDTMLIVTADHGDELFENGRVGHGASEHEALIHVPMLIHYPPLFPAGRITEGVEAVDIVPTIADALGVKADPEWQGQSLVPLVQGVGRGYPRMSMSSLYENAHAARMGRWKLRAARSAARLYDVVKDPDEKTDLAGKRPIEERMLADALWTLRAFDEEWRKSKWGNPANVTPAFANEVGP